MIKLLKGAQAKQVKKPNINGVVLYNGPSVLDGKPIVVVATFKTANGKTGNMVQTWILREDINPVEASKQGADVSICGNCPHKQNTGGACYVNIGQAPNAVYKAYKRGSYPSYSPTDHDHLFSLRKIRLGAYGDPAAVPFDVMDNVARLGLGWTGYTHQHGHKNFDSRFFTLCMASADSPKQAVKLQLMGAKTFRVAMQGDALDVDEVECLSDSKGIQCIDCGLCDGNKKNVAITIHGARQARFKTSTLINSVNI